MSNTSSRPAASALLQADAVHARSARAHLRLANLVANPLFSDVTRCFEDLLRRSGAALDVERDTPAMLGALYRYILLRKRA